MSVRTELPKEKANLTAMSLHAVVKGKDKDSHEWNEVADLLTVSPTGSSFNLGRSCEVGTLISLMLPLPAHMRCYDHDKELYRVWGLVQHCSPITANDQNAFYVGVAFIGREAPASHKANPNQSYRISGVGENGMWSVNEWQTPFKKRADIRFWSPIDLYLAIVDTKNGATGGERTIAENVSKSGAAVYTTLDVGIGDRVKFISEEYDFSGLSVVCNKQTGDDGRTRLHLRFIEANFPIELVMKTVEMSQQV